MAEEAIFDIRSLPIVGIGVPGFGVRADVAPGIVPPTPVKPRLPFKIAPNWTPMSRLKLRVATTMRASISTCGSGWSRMSISCLIASMFERTSVTISEFERASISIEPRRERRRLMIGRRPSAPLPPAADAPPEEAPDEAPESTAVPAVVPCEALCHEAIA